MDKDIRTLCYKCKTETIEAGYRVFRTANDMKSECDKCNRQGFDYILKEKR